MAVNRKHIDSQSRPTTAAFRNRGGGMSTDWEKYSTPEETECRLGDPDKYGVVAMNVGAVRRIEIYDVDHTPIDENPSHSDVTGPKSVEEEPDPQKRMKVQTYRLDLMATATWVIPKERFEVGAS